MTGGGVEVIAGAVAKQVVSKLGDLAWEEAKLLWRFKEDANDLSETMTKLEALTRDAEIRSRKDGGDTARLWLRDLKSAAYNIEDVLDEFNSEQLIWNNNRNKFKLFFSIIHNPALLRLTMPHKMKKVRNELEKLWKQQNESLKLVAWPNIMETSKNRETFAATIDNLVGRDGTKEEIMRLIMQSDVEEDISIIPIVGLGGLGKTTLAQAVLADKRSETFDISAWVYVSENFDLEKIGKDIISGVDSSVYINNCSLHVIKTHLQRILSRGKYLIVLDDFWEEDGDKLEKLKQMLQYGNKGSKIIITTRSDSVAEKLRVGVLSNKRKIGRVDHAIKLGFLTPEDCWEIMKQRAFGPLDDQSELEEIGKQIAAKCGGVPLVANSLGYIMSHKQTVAAWSDIRDTMMVLDLKEGNESTTLERMLLSYYHMQPDYKLCFVYCAVFPKGFVVDSNRLIQQWDALGYIGANQGQNCINYLLGMSFLQISKTSLIASVHDVAPQKLSMHDLVHEVATKIATSEFFTLDSTTIESWNRSKKHERKHCRHVQLVHYDKQSMITEGLPSKVRSLHFRECNIVELPKETFSRSKYLRVLDLSGCSVIRDCPVPSNIRLPSSISKLKLLRYLDVTGLAIEALPDKSLHTLQNLQTLILANTSLRTLPNDMDSLGKLCYLDLSGSSIHMLPVSFGNLSELSHLNLSRCSKLEDLPESTYKLKCLVQLHMSECCNLQKLPLQFGTLPKLSFLNLSGCSKLSSLPADLSLTSLENLNLSSCHDLEGLPDSFGNLDKLEILNLSDCYKLQVLPESFCQLKQLKTLDLSDCQGLRGLHECFGNLSELQYLNLTSCSKVHFLPESFCKLLKLTDLDLSFCVKLENLPSSFGDLKNLKNLDISGCVQFCDLPDSILDMTSLTRLEVMTGKGTLENKLVTIRKHLKLPSRTTHCIRGETESGGYCSVMEIAKLTCRELEVKGLENVKQCEDVGRDGLCNNSELRLLHLQWEHESNQLHGSTDTVKDKLVLEKLLPPRTLKHFALQGYMSKDFPKWISDISFHLPSITILGLFDIGACDDLPPFGQLPNLRSLFMRNMPNLRKIRRGFYGEKGTCEKLRVIQLRSMQNLEEWWMTRSGSDDENEGFLVPNLHVLDTRDCPKLKFLPYPPKSVHWWLDNSDEVLPAHGFGKLTSSTLPFSMTIKNGIVFESIWDRLGYLSSVEILVLLSCKNMKTLPQAVQTFKSLRVLQLVKCDALDRLPEWLGQIQSLKKIVIDSCFSLDSMPETTRKLALEELHVQDCPILIRRCKGEDAEKISHIPNVTLNFRYYDFEPWNHSRRPTSFF